MCENRETFARHTRDRTNDPQEHHKRRGALHSTEYSFQYRTVVCRSILYALYSSSLLSSPHRLQDVKDAPQGAWYLLLVSTFGLKGCVIPITVMWRL